MKNLFTALAVATLAASTYAQTYQVVPAGYDSKEAPYYSSRFGVYSAMRIMWADGEFGNTAGVVKGMGFRLDRNVSSWTHYGRKHSNLMIYCSGGNHSTMTSTFSANVIGTPTMVYSGANAMPAFPSSGPTPAPWHNSLNIPFSTSYVHTGVNELLIDSQMSGGTLDNSVTWTTTSYRGYFLDSINVSTYGGGSSYTRYGNGAYTTAVGYQNRSGCKDSTNTLTYGPYMYTYIYRYAPQNSSTSLRNRVRAYNYGYYYPSNTTTAIVMGVANKSGSSFPGVTCNKVYVNLALLPIIRLVKSATTTGSYTYVRDYFFGSSSATIPHNPAFIGASVMTQGAFADTKTGAMRISQATESTYPNFISSWKRKTVYRQGSSNPTTGYSPNITPYYFPVIRYTK